MDSAAVESGVYAASIFKSLLESEVAYSSEMFIILLLSTESKRLRAKSVLKQIFPN
jgi:hypothetical protein